MMYGPIFMGIQTLIQVAINDSNSIMGWVSIPNILIAAIGYGLYRYHNRLPVYFSSGSSEVELNLYQNDDILMFTNYMAEFKEFYDLPQKREYGDLSLAVLGAKYQINMSFQFDLMELSKKYRTSLNTYVKFYDYKF